MAQVVNPRFEIDTTEEGFTPFLRGVMVETGAEYSRKLADTLETQLKAMNVLDKEAKVYPGLPITINPLEA